MDDLERLAEIFARSPVRGSFKPTQKIAGEIPNCGYDFMNFLSEKGSFIARSDFNSSGTYICDEQWSTSADKNHILVDGRIYNLQPPKEDITTRILRGTGIFRKLEPKKVYVITIGLLSGEYNKINGYSFDVRNGKGTAHFALDFTLTPEDFAKAMELVRKEPQMVNELIKNLPKGKVCYNLFRAGQPTEKVPIALYEGYIDYNGRENFRVEVKK